MNKNTLWPRLRWAIGAVIVSLLAACGSAEPTTPTVAATSTTATATTGQATATDTPTTGTRTPTEVPKPTTTEPTAAQSTADPTTIDPTPTGQPAAAPATSEASSTPAPTGPASCGAVTSTIGTEVSVEILAGNVTCAFALDLLDTYYNNPPEPHQGSGAYLMIGDWDCNSSSTQDPGRASTCRTQEGGLIVAWE